MTDVVNSQLWWHVARSGGIVAWALLTASVIWGLALSTKITNGRPRPNWLLDLHRYLGGLAVVFTGVHVASLVLDTYVSFGLTEILIPFTGDYRPGWVALGVIGLYLMAAVEITSLLRKRLSKRVWRSTHLLSFPLFFLATAHGIRAGTDGTGRPLLYTMIAATVAVVALTAARIDQALGSRSAPQTQAARSTGNPSGDRAAGLDRAAALARARAAAGNGTRGGSGRSS